MMPTAALISLTIFAFVSSITPGPNNVMLAASGLRFGFRPTVPHMIGITTGFTVMLLLIGAGLGAIFEAEPRLLVALKFVGAAYLLYLAFMLWRASKPGEASASQPLGWFGAAMFQFVNPKAWVMALSAVAAFAGQAGDYTHGVLLVALVFAVVNLPCVLVWVAFGAVIRRWMDNERVMVLINRGMALLTAACVWMILA